MPDEAARTRLPPGSGDEIMQALKSSKESGGLLKINLVEVDDDGIGRNLNILDTEGGLVQLTMGLSACKTALLTVRGGKDHDLDVDSLEASGNAALEYAKLLRNAP